MTHAAAERPGAIPTGRGRRRKARGSMSSQAILDGAREVVERDGLQRLSMPTLARHLDCGVTSIYWYFHSKDELLAALTEQVMRDLHRQLPPAGDGPWSAELIAYFTAYRDLMESLTAYREVVLYAPAFVLRAALTPAQLRRLDTGVGLLRRAGLPLQDAASVYNVCLNYTRSFVAFEHGTLAAAADLPGASRSARAEALSAADYPTLSLLPDIEPLLGLDESGFRLGLELLVEGIARRYSVRRPTE
jgi:AcrR family transcriptional regulator